jgi:hypothetical protein
MLHGEWSFRRTDDVCMAGMFQLRTKQKYVEAVWFKHVVLGSVLEVTPCS